MQGDKTNNLLEVTPVNGESNYKHLHGQETASWINPRSILAGRLFNNHINSSNVSARISNYVSKRDSSSSLLDHSKNKTNFTYSGGGGDGDSDDESNLLQSFNLSAPTAAVIGAGMAGVHVAYELAELGFKVTLIEQNNHVAQGATSFALPCAGVGLLSPALASLRMAKEVCTNLLSVHTCPAIISRDHFIHSFLSPYVQRWLWSRTHSMFSEREVMWYTNNLSSLSVAVIHSMLSKYPELHECVADTPLRVHQLHRRGHKSKYMRLTSTKWQMSPTSSSPSLSSSSSPLLHEEIEHGEYEEEKEEKFTDKVNNRTVESVNSSLVSNAHNTQLANSLVEWEPAETAHPFPLAINPVTWSRKLLEISKTNFNVEVLLNERVEQINVSTHFGAETVYSLTTSHAKKSDSANNYRVDDKNSKNKSANVETRQTRELVNRSYDVVVLTAGSETAALANYIVKLPLVNLRGWEVVLHQPSREVQEKIDLYAASLSPFTQLLSQMHTNNQSNKYETRQCGLISLYALSQECSLFGVRIEQPMAHVNTPVVHTNNLINNNHGNLNSNHDNRVQEYILRGLLSFDTTQPKLAISMQSLLARMEGYLRVKCGIDAPLLENAMTMQRTWHKATQDNASSSSLSSSSAASEEEELKKSSSLLPTIMSKENNSLLSDSNIGDKHEGDLNEDVNRGNDKHINKTSAHEYIRSFTPDGVPIIDYGGNVLNLFVCSGFGDHTTDFAPGASKMIRNLIEQRAEMLLKRDKTELLHSHANLATNLPASQLSYVQQCRELLIHGILPSSVIASSEQRPSDHINTATLMNSDMGYSNNSIKKDNNNNNNNNNISNKNNNLQENVTLSNPFSVDRFTKGIKADTKLNEKYFEKGMIDFEKVNRETRKQPSHTSVLQKIEKKCELCWEWFSAFACEIGENICNVYVLPEFLQSYAETIFVTEDTLRKREEEDMHKTAKIRELVEEREVYSNSYSTEIATIIKDNQEQTTLREVKARRAFQEMFEEEKEQICC